MNLAVTPCPSAKEHWRCCAPPRRDLPSSDISRVYMPWSMTPVVPTVFRQPMLPSRSLDSLGHHGTGRLTGLDPFTHDALRPAHSLSTLRRLPRDSPRKTRYREGLRGSQPRAIPRFAPVSTDGTCTRWLMSALPGAPNDLRTPARLVGSRGTRLLVEPVGRCLGVRGPR
jgi:hypothetical protein